MDQRQVTYDLLRNHHSYCTLLKHQNFFCQNPSTKSCQQGRHLSDSETIDSETSQTTEVDDDFELLSLQQGNIYKEMVYVALQSKQDIHDTPGHSSNWQGIDQHHVD